MKRNSRTNVALWAVILCSIGAATPTPAQDGAKPAVEKKWRPKDGIYGFDMGTAAPCDSHPLSYVELSKGTIGADEVYKCKIRKVTDAGPGLLRLDATCDDETKGKYSDIITFRKIDETSFFMSTQPRRPPSKLAYCRGIDEAAKVNWPFDLNESEAERKWWEENGKWGPLYGVYAKPGNDFNDRCLKAEDVVIDFDDFSLSGGSSHCRVVGVDESSKNYRSLNVICDQKPNAVGVVLRKKGDFVAPGSEKIALSKTGDQTITIRRSQDGEFSEPAQELAYCPDAAQRAYADSKKAK